MSYFRDLRYVIDDGQSAPVDPTDPDNPYSNQTSLGHAVLMGKPRTLRWLTESGVPRELHFQSTTMAAVDPRSGLLVVVLHFSEPVYRRPANAVAFCDDGTLDHVINPPMDVEQVIEHLPGQVPKTQRFPVEAIVDVLLIGNRLVLGLNFRYEWIERRYYDPAARLWLERDQIFRQ
jgi:hypothetical protein